MARPMTKAEWITAMILWQVPVKYYPGWDTRGRPGDFADINGVFIHHTGSDAGQSDDYLHFLFVDGRASEGIPGPLCHSAADMDGDLWMGAIGRANHAGRGSSGVLQVVVNEDYRGFSAELDPGPDNTDGNAHFYGCEVRYDGGQPMTPKQYATAVRWAAAICHHYGWSALSVIGHREWTSRKNDPGNCPMYKFRADVAALLKAGPPTTGGTPVQPPTEDDMPYTPEQLEQYAGIGVHGQKIGRSDVTIGLALESTMKNSAAAVAQITALTAVVQTLAEKQGLDAAALTTAVQSAVDQALADLKITLAVDSGTPPAA